MELNQLRQITGVSFAPTVQQPIVVFEQVELPTDIVEALSSFARELQDIGLLTEDVQLSYKQIDQLFQDIESYLNSDSARVSNKTFWGRGVEAIKRKLKTLFDLKDKAKVGPVKNYDNVKIEADSKIEKSNLPQEQQNMALKTVDTLYKVGKLQPYAQKFIVQVIGGLVASTSATNAVRKVVIPAIANQSRKLLNDESGLNGLIELLFTEAESQLPDTLITFDKNHAKSTVKEAFESNAQLAKAIHKYSKKISDATERVKDQVVISSIFAYQSGNKTWEAAKKKAERADNKFFIWKNGVYYAGDVQDIMDMTFEQIAEKVKGMTSAIAESIELNENFITDFFGKLKDKVKSWQAKKGDTNNFSSIVTYDKIERAWVKAGKPRDLTELQDFLSGYLTKAYGSSHHLAIHTMIDDFFEDLRDKLGGKEPEADSEEPSKDEAPKETSSTNAEPEAETKSTPAGASKEFDPSEGGAETADISSPGAAETTEEPADIELSSDEKSILKQLFYAIKKGAVDKTIAQNPHKQKVLMKALPKLYSKHGVELKEEITEFSKEMILETVRTKAGLPVTKYSKLLAILEREVKFF